MTVVVEVLMLEVAPPLLPTVEMARAGEGFFLRIFSPGTLPRGMLGKAIYHSPFFSQRPLLLLGVGIRA